MPIGQAKFGLLGGVADLGKLELIETQEYSSNVTEVDFTNIQESTYNVHFMTCNNMTRGDAGSGDTRPIVQLFESGTIEDASVYSVAQENYFSANTNTSGTTNSTAINYITAFTDSDGTSSNKGQSNGIIYFYNLGDSSRFSFASSLMSSTSVGGVYSQVRFGSGVLPQASTVDGIRIRWETATHEFGNYSISLYGIKES